jgi:hypothetical protein
VKHGHAKSHTLLGTSSPPVQATPRRQAQSKVIREFNENMLRLHLCVHNLRNSGRQIAFTDLELGLLVL